MKRGELWLAAVDKVRPVLIMSTFTGLRDIQAIPVTSRYRGLATEVRVGPDDGLALESVLNAQQMQLVPVAAFVRRIGQLGPDRMAQVCTAVTESIGC